MKRKRCLWLKNRKAKFAGAKASRKKRSKQRFQRPKAPNPGIPALRGRFKKAHTNFAFV